MKKVSLVIIALIVLLAGHGYAQEVKKYIYNPGKIKPTDSVMRVKPGDKAEDFTLPSLSGEKISLSQFQNKKNVVISFVPAAWTPVCSAQWPGYNLLDDIFKENDAVLLGITVDNIPTLYAWTTAMGGVNFPVLSDFWPHGKVAQQFGLLRRDGVSERAIVVIDKKGTIRYAEAYDINVRPPADIIIGQLKKINQEK